MKILEAVVKFVEVSASQEQIETGDYPERQINSLTNFELLELLSEALGDLPLLDGER